jgi:hypothetical protein
MLQLELQQQQWMVTSRRNQIKVKIITWQLFIKVNHEIHCLVCFDSATIAASVAAATSGAAALEITDYIMIFFLRFTITLLDIQVK